MRLIGNDETVARHVAINTTSAKLIPFAVSAAPISATGAVMAPRCTYVDPAPAFNSLISFQVVIMALPGGIGVLYGPLLGVVPLVLINEVIAKQFSSNFPLVLGIVFIVIVYFLPHGVVGLVQRWRAGAIRLPTVVQRGTALPPHRIARLGIARTFRIVRVLESMNCRDKVIAGLVCRPGTRIADGPPTSVLAEPEVVAAYIGDTVA
jgi:branched-chain amino acid transport system permease protein